MVVLPHFVSVHQDPEGLPTVEVTFDISPAQLAAALQALRTIRDTRYRSADMSADDVLAMRELTSLVDELADLPAAEGLVRMQAAIGRLATLRDALHEFAAAEHLEREGDAAARPAAYELVDALDDLYAEAVRAALDGSSLNA